MGRRCGYLALASGIASGAEMELLPEDDVTMESLRHDIEMLREGFRRARSLASSSCRRTPRPITTPSSCGRVMEAEAHGAFEVRESILGHLQRGGVPTAFDRIQGSRLGARAAQQIMADIAASRADVNVIGVLRRGVVVTPFAEAMATMDWENERPQEQAFMQWRKLADTLAKPGPGENGK